MPQAQIDWPAVRAEVLAHEGLEPRRPKLKTATLASELAQVARLESLSSTSGLLPQRVLSHQLAYVSPRDTEGAQKAAREILTAFKGRDFASGPVRLWSLITNPWLLLPNLADPKLALEFNQLLLPFSHSVSWHALEVVDRLGPAAKPVLTAWLPGLAKYRAEKALVLKALKRT